MAAVALILLTAGLTAYTLVSPGLGVALWIAAVLVAGAGIAVRVTGRRSRRGAHSIRS